MIRCWNNYYEPGMFQLGLLAVNLIIGEGRAERAPFLELWPHPYH